MPQQDLKNNQDIRKVLVRHWIDLGRVGIYSRSGNVTIRGNMQLLRGVKHDLDSQLMENIFREINRIKEIKRVHVELDNWTFLEGAWHKRENAKVRAKSYDDTRPGTYEM